MQGPRISGAAEERYVEVFCVGGFWFGPLTTALRFPALMSVTVELSRRSAWGKTAPHTPGNQYCAGKRIYWRSLLARGPSLPGKGRTMSIFVNKNAFVEPTAMSIGISQMFTVAAGGNNPLYLVLTVLDRDEYTAGASGATGSLSGQRSYLATQQPRRRWTRGAGYRLHFQDVDRCTTQQYLWLLRSTVLQFVRQPE